MSEEYPYVEMNSENKEKLIRHLAFNIACSSSEQEDMARNGFVGVENMTQEEFNEYWYQCF